MKILRTIEYIARDSDNDALHEVIELALEICSETERALKEALSREEEARKLLREKEMEIGSLRMANATYEINEKAKRVRKQHAS